VSDERERREWDLNEERQLTKSSCLDKDELLATISFVLRSQSFTPPSSSPVAKIVGLLFMKVDTVGGEGKFDWNGSIFDNEIGVSTCSKSHNLRDKSEDMVINLFSSSGINIRDRIDAS